MKLYVSVTSVPFDLKVAVNTGDDLRQRRNVGWANGIEHIEREIRIGKCNGYRAIAIPTEGKFAKLIESICHWAGPAV
ncbi:hypothetical protein [Methylosinus sp. PW1]|uniref:hypothetical protein n=1 Tax=Methylosinus sp. PW1 TaxID=107636 RepID=UPI0012EB625E|nr:hypothetical protein [Methylosinus sp. PW1]